MDILQKSKIFTATLIALSSSIANAEPHKLSPSATQYGNEGIRVMGNFVVSEGDMIIGLANGFNEKNETLKNTSNLSGTKTDSMATFNSLKNLWIGGKVNFFLDPAITSEHRNLIAQAMNNFESKVGGINFNELSSKSGDYIYIRYINESDNLSDSTGGLSVVGKAGGEQPLLLRKDSLKKHTVLHELGHALGYLHEQNRPDRNNYIYVNYPDLDECSDWFVINEKQSIDSPYDVDSIMHYPTWRSKEPCMKREARTHYKLNGDSIPQPQSLSTLDIDRLRQDYGNYPSLAAGFNGCGYRGSNGVMWWPYNTPNAHQYVLKYRLSLDDEWQVLDVLLPQNTNSGYQTINIKDYNINSSKFQVNILYEDINGLESAPSIFQASQCNL